MKIPQYVSLFIRQLRPSQPHSSLPLRLLRPLSQRTHPLRNPFLAIAQPKRTQPLQTRNSSTAAIPTTNADQNRTASGGPGEGYSAASTQAPEGKYSSKPSNAPEATSNAHEPNTESSSKPSNIRHLGGPPSYHLVFTCKPCGNRSAHKISKQGYHRGTVLITCPECKNRHVISDHLKIFSDISITIEDLMREKGELVKRGSITEQGDVEFWTDESEQLPPQTLEESEEAVSMPTVRYVTDGKNTSR